MTYSLSQYLSEDDRAQAAWEDNEEDFARTMPWWETAEAEARAWESEDARYVSMEDVIDPEEPGPVRRYGRDDFGRWVPGCWD